MSTNVLESCTIVTLVSLLLRWGVSLYPYSGAGKPPMFGDYEAQRHWQEITVNLPVSEWYSNSSSNDLLYWGLDYPPLTAYHSYANGLLARRIEPKFVALNQSRGYESYEHKLFMRYTVFIADLLVFLPAVVFVMKASKSRFSSAVSSKLSFLSLLLYPGLVLIDYGHFQYNNVSLGLFLAAVAAVVSDWDCLGSLFFSLALNYKQMELYHALPFFFYLLGKCFKEDTYQRTAAKLVSVGGTVALVFVVLWAPYFESVSTFSQVVSRVFPINRGLFEDKVASVWCSLSILIKFKDILENSRMALLCLLSTGLLSLPSCFNLLRNVSASHFKYSLINVAFVFFLFSYHVHEKSILLVTVPACLVFSDEPFMVSWLSVVGQLSMLPLLDRDGLLVPWVSLTVGCVLVYRLAVSYCTAVRHSTALDQAPELVRVWLWRACCLSAVVGTALALAYKCIAPPTRYPDLYPVLIALFSCLHFCCFALYFHYRQFTLPQPERLLSKKMK